jgi:long-subunit acyl-CoA synthetase (AMP-forming)
MDNSHKFSSFSELVDFLQKQNQSDLFRYLENGQVRFLSSGDWAKRVHEKEKEFAKAHYSSLAIIENKTPEMAADLFAAVIAGKRLLLIDPMESLEKMMAMLSFCDIEEIRTDDALEEEEIASLRHALKPAKHVKSQEEGQLLFFTSGTSGTPKAVVLTSASLLDSSYNGQSRLPCGSGDIVYSCLPLSHVFGFVCTFLWPLCYGGSVALGNGLKSIPSDVMSFKPTILPVIPTLAAFLLSVKAVNPELKTILVGAGPLSSTLIGAYQALGKRVAFGYGLTETSSGVAISVGAKDPFAMQPCPEDSFRIEEDGTVSIHSGGLMVGYYKNKEATEAVVRDGWLKTNDRGYLDSDGNLHIQGRKDDIAVLSNGTKYDCAMGEEKLIHYLGMMIDGALYAKEGKLTLLVYLPKPELKAAVEQAVEAFNQNSELYTKISQINYSLTPLPRTKTGKIIRYQLPQ